MAKGMEQYQKESSSRRSWAQSDPFALVGACEDSLHEIESQIQDETLVGPLQEVIARFQGQSRVTLGTGTGP